MLTNEMWPRKAEDARLRRVAAKHGYGLTRSRKAEGINNFGGYLLFDLPTNAVIAGSRFDLSPADAWEWLANEHP